MVVRGIISAFNCDIYNNVGFTLHIYLQKGAMCTVAHFFVDNML